MTASVRIVAVLLGAAFGFLIAWSGAADPAAIRHMLLLQDGRLYLMMASAVAVAFVGLRLLRRRGARALVTGEAVAWPASTLGRRHVAGGVVFGLGWALADACPGPVVVQVGEGYRWGALTLLGIVIGVALHGRGRAFAALGEARVAGPAAPADEVA